MQIIIVHPKLSRARTLRLRTPWLLGGVLVALMLIGSIGAGISYLALRDGIGDAERLSPLALDPAASPMLASQASATVPQAAPVSSAAAVVTSGAPVKPASGRRATETYIRQNIDALAVRLGELQARMTRLDALGERVGGMVGIGGQEAGKPAPGRGGALPSLGESLSLSELSREIDQVATQIERRGDQLSMVESELVLRRTMARLLPTARPLEDGLPGSRFGWRIDPFTGRRAMHEGIDFTASYGTPIVAAGAGVVIAARWHRQYGRHVDIDHGDGVVTRYAHASKLLVKTGDIVHRGERIGLVGSTGRSTGPHLHFEVRVDGRPRDPLKFMRESQFAWKDGVQDSSGKVPASTSGALARR